MFDDTAHEILRERDEVRLKALARDRRLPRPPRRRDELRRRHRHRRRRHGRSEPRRRAGRRGVGPAARGRGPARAIIRTGRSAAFWAESYGGPFIQPLTTASGAVPGGAGLPRAARRRSTSPRPRASTRWTAIEAEFGDRVGFERLDRAGSRRCCPAFAPAGRPACSSRAAPTSTSPACTLSTSAAARRHGAPAGRPAPRCGRCGGTAPGWSVETAAGAFRARRDRRRGRRLGRPGRRSGGRRAASASSPTGGRSRSLRVDPPAPAGPSARDRRARALLLQARGRGAAVAQPARRDALRPLRLRVRGARRRDRHRPARAGGGLEGRAGRAKLGGPSKLRPRPPAGLRLRSRTCPASSGAPARAASESRPRRPAEAGRGPAARTSAGSRSRALFARPLRRRLTSWRPCSSSLWPSPWTPSRQPCARAPWRRRFEGPRFESERLSERPRA